MNEKVVGFGSPPFCLGLWLRLRIVCRGASVVYRLYVKDETQIRFTIRNLNRNRYLKNKSAQWILGI
jgi:hypothetical protein